MVQVAEKMRIAHQNIEISGTMYFKLNSTVVEGYTNASS